MAVLSTAPSLTCSLLPRPRLDPNLHVDASPFGLGFVINNQYASWRLSDSWSSDGQDIGWAESVALELSIYWLIQMGY